MKNGRDFTIKTYEYFLKSIIDKSAYSIHTCQQFFESNANDVLIFRHDVDRDPGKALLMARLENKYKIRSSYYFRMTRNSFDPDVIGQIVRLGHEIGYHYEDLASAKGDFEQAINSFKSNLAKLREFYPVTTICMHGSPLSRWDNRTLWSQYDYKEFNITGEPYFDLDINRVYYITDASRSWNNEKVTIRDKVDSNFNFSISSSYDIISLIMTNALPRQVMINIHPHNWTDNPIVWLKILTYQQVKNLIKRLLIKYGR